jgi:L-iditol 2-dehydrogenase
VSVTADETMQAAVLYGKEDLRLEIVARPHAAPGELVLQVGAALTCGTDLKVYRRGYHARMLKPPVLFGHEIAGTVVEAGEGAPFQPGDRVVALNSAPCGSCFFCRGGQPNLCDDLLFNNGAYAEFLRVPARIAAKNTLRLPQNMPFEHAALTEPLACVVLGLEESYLLAASGLAAFLTNAPKTVTENTSAPTIAIIGGGPIGLLFIHTASLIGLRVIAVIKHADQAALATELGAAHTVLLHKNGTSPVEAVRAFTQGERGADVSIEAVATPQAWEWAIDMTRKGGSVNFFGGPPSGTTVSLDTNLLHYNGLSLRASFHHTPATVRTAFALLSGGCFHTKAFLTGHAALRDLPALYKTLSGPSQPARSRRPVKTVILP